MINRRTLLVGLSASIPAGGSVGAAFADSYPSRPIKVIVPFPAGGPSDGMARIAAERLAVTLGQSVVVENRGGGAGGSVGAMAVATAEPDGYTILLTAPGPLTVGPAVNKNLEYDPRKVFTPVGLLMVSPLVMCVLPSLPVKTLAELVAYAKANPGKITYGSQGYGTTPHLLLEMLKQETGVNIVHVAYRGTAPALNDLMGGRIQMFTDTTTVVIPQIQAGNLRPLAVTTATRSAQLPDVPTTAEAGFPTLRAQFWLGVVAPAGTPADVVNRLNAAFNEALRSGDARARLESLGAEIKLGAPQEFGKMLADELAMWTAFTAETGIKID
jgi:tripartite-type tricarboxylate transporter receptor subunit TctC